MGQVSCLGDLSNSVIAACLPLPPPLPTLLILSESWEEAATWSPLESSSWASDPPRTVPSLAQRKSSPDGACKRESQVA